MEDLPHTIHRLRLLSGRERDVLRERCQGKSIEKVAKALFISESTVKFHLGNIYQKLELNGLSPTARAFELSKFCAALSHMSDEVILPPAEPEPEPEEPAQQALIVVLEDELAIVKRQGDVLQPWGPPVPPFSDSPSLVHSRWRFLRNVLIVILTAAVVGGVAGGGVVALILGSRARDPEGTAALRPVSNPVSGGRQTEAATTPSVVIAQATTSAAAPPPVAVAQPTMPRNMRCSRERVAAFPTAQAVAQQLATVVARTPSPASTVVVPPPTARTGFIGRWFLNNDQMAGGPAIEFSWGSTGDIPLVGDWDGDCVHTVGLFRNGKWLLSNQQSGGGSEVIEFDWGSPGDTPLVGDWDGDGIDDPGLYRNGKWSLRKRRSGGDIEIAEFNWGGVGDIPVVGDWNGDGIDTPGLYNNTKWSLSNQLTGSGVDINGFGWGGAGDLPLVGDWDGDGIDTPGTFKNGNWALRNRNEAGGANRRFSWGGVGDIPLVGDWDGDGIDTFGLAR